MLQYFSLTSSCLTVRRLPGLTPSVGLHDVVPLQSRSNVRREPKVATI